jgi:HAD superfamily phosphatase (TIGR01668 family)
LLERVCPDRCTGGLEDISLDELWAEGYRAILLDLDNTVTAWKSCEVPAAKAEWIGRAKERFGVCIVSNTIRGERLKRLAAGFGIEHVARWWRGRKPSPQGLREAMARLASTPEQTVMIGDQVLTDIWAGRRAGVHTILVAPISPVEFAGTKITRFFERIVLWLLRRRKMI